MNRAKEISKFICGAVAFHGIVHLYFWLSGTSLTVFGVTQTSNMNLGAALASLLLVGAFGYYAWGAPISSRGSKKSQAKYNPGFSGRT